MKISEPKVTQAKVENVNIKNFIQNDFLGLLEKEFGHIRFNILSFYIEHKKDDKIERERITFTHISPKEEESNILMIDTDKPETFPKIYKVIQKYMEE